MADEEKPVKQTTKTLGGLLALLVIAGAIAGVALWTQKDEAAKTEAKEKSEKLFDFDKTKVKSVRLEKDGKLTAALVKELAKATGPSGMIGGQVLDMEGQTRTMSMDELKNLHSRKTGALITAACRLGAISAKASMQLLEAVSGYGQHLGLAFQIVDDLLDVTASAEQLGKSTGKDESKGKNTYPALMGIERSRSEAEKQYEAAIKALEPLGNRADGLRALARFVVDRKN